jgi:hypothetical protein
LLDETWHAALLVHIQIAPLMEEPIQVMARPSEQAGLLMVFEAAFQPWMRHVIEESNELPSSFPLLYFRLQLGMAKPLCFVPRMRKYNVSGSFWPHP